MTLTLHLYFYRIELIFNTYIHKWNKPIVYWWYHNKKFYWDPSLYHDAAIQNKGRGYAHISSSDVAFGPYDSYDEMIGPFTSFFKYNPRQITVKQMYSLPDWAVPKKTYKPRSIG